MRHRILAANHKRRYPSGREFVGIHPQGAEFHAAVQAFRPRTRPGRAEGDIDWQQMFIGRVLLNGGRGTGSVSEQVGDAPFRKRLMEPIGEGDHARHFRRIHRRAVQDAQIMRETAGADDQHAFGTQRRQGAAELHVMRRAEMALDGKLQHRDIRRRPDERKRDPGAMVQAALAVDIAGQARRREQFADPVGQRRGARRGILDFVQGARKAAEIMDRLIDRDGIDGRARQVAPRAGARNSAITSDF